MDTWQVLIVTRFGPSKFQVGKFDEYFKNYYKNDPQKTHGRFGLVHWGYYTLNPKKTI
jgi:hypothetical protein